MDIILKYFPDLSSRQIDQFARMESLYKEWNAKVNVISRKDVDALYLHHVLHSLAIAKVITFKAGAEILDLGTGGGFPGIPLAILFPELHFHLIDGTLKKIKVVQEITAGLSLTNVQSEQARAEELKGRKFDFVVTRAVADLSQLLLWSAKLYKTGHKHVLPNGLLALKGGDIKAEITSLPKGEYSEVFAIYEFFKEPFFQEKFVVYVQG